MHVRAVSPPAAGVGEGKADFPDQVRQIIDLHVQARHNAMRMALLSGGSLATEPCPEAPQPTVWIAHGHLLGRWSERRYTR
jgi:hypothetical protein